MNQALGFLLLIAAASFAACVIAALLGGYQIAIGALYLSLIVGAPTYCVLLTRHLSPKEEQE